MRILLTGATGFIGKHLLAALSQKGHQIVALYRLPLRVERIDNQSNVKWVPIDDQLGSFLLASEKFDAIIHLATTYFRDGVSALESIRANVEFPLFLMDYATSGGCDFFINTDTFFSKKDFEIDYLAEYVLTKRIVLQYGKLVSGRNSQFTFVNARLEHVYGPGERVGKFMPNLINDLLSNKKEIDLTSCEQRRDFIYVADVVSAYLAILSNIHKVTGFVELGVGVGKSVSLKKIVTLTKDLCKSNTILKFGALSYRSGEIMNSVADTSLLSSMGWKPKYSLIAGVKLVINSYYPDEAA